MCGENSPIKITFQIAIPVAPGKSGESSSTEDTRTICVEASSINSGIDLLNDYLNKEVSLTHCKVIVFSEEIAQSGISPYLNTLFNNVEIRPTCSVFISRSDAKSFLNTAGQFFEGTTAKSYDLIAGSTRYNGYIANSNLGKFFSSVQDTYSQGFATLVSVNNEETSKLRSDIVPSINVHSPNYEANLSAGESYTEQKDGDAAELLGIAVFRKDKLVGELNAMETFSHLLVTGEIDEAILTATNPLKEQEVLNLQLTIKKKPKISVKIVDGFPFICVQVFVTAKLLSIDSGEDYSNNEVLKELEDYTSSYLQEAILEYLYKTAKVYNTDIASFGSRASFLFPTWKDWEEYNWLANYENSFFEVEVKTNIHSSSFLQKV